MKEDFSLEFELSVLLALLNNFDDATSNSDGHTIEYIVSFDKERKIKLKIDGNMNHGRPHLHLDFGKNHHAATYSIDTAERLVGNVKSKHDKCIKVWIKTYQGKLLEAWKFTQDGKEPKIIIEELKRHSIP